MQTQTRKLKGGRFRTRLSFTQAEISRTNVQMQLRGAGIELPAAALTDFDNRGILNFGWFGSNNANTFYPGLNVPEELIPKPEDFIMVPFRLLSATIVGAYSWKATDFSDEKMLKASIEKMRNKAIYFDHDTDVLNWVGIVSETKWTPAFRAVDGTPVPAGMDGVLAIDAKTNPKLARGLLIRALYSNSVTVEFDWIPSHTFDSGWEFDNKVGTLGPDGKMVRRIVTLIHDYHETSICWLGADPYAKAIDANGELINIDRGSVVSDEALVAKEKENALSFRKYGLSLRYNVKSALSLTQQGQQNPQPKNNTMTKFLAAFLATFGKSLGFTKEDELTEAMVAQLEVKDPEKEKKLGWFNKLFASALKLFKGADGKEATEIADFDKFIAEHEFVLSADLTKLKATEAQLVKLHEATGYKADDKVTFEAHLVSLAAMAKVGSDYTTFKRTEAVRLYKLQMGAKADEAVVKLIEAAGNDALPGLLAQYVKGATEKFSGHCKKCGAEEFEFRSSLETPDTGDTKVPAAGNTFSDIYEKFDQQKMILNKGKKDKEAVKN